MKRTFSHSLIHLILAFNILSPVHSIASFGETYSRLRNRRIDDDFMHWCNIVFSFYVSIHQIKKTFLSIIITEYHPTNVKSSQSSLEHGNPIIADKAQPKLHAQKRGGNEMCHEKAFYSNKNRRRKKRYPFYEQYNI